LPLVFSAIDNTWIVAAVQVARGTANLGIDFAGGTLGTN